MSTKIDTKFIETEPYKTCDTCSRGVVTKHGVLCGESLAGICKPNLLETPKYYVNWETVDDD